MAHPQDSVHQLSIRDPEAFWQHHAQAINWHTRPSRALSRQTKTLLPSGTTHDHWSWFPDGELSTTYNCVDRHVRDGRGDNVAIIWESPVSGRRETFTYRQVLEEVKVLAGVLHEQGVRKGDVVVIYMPMIPAALFAALAITRLGAIHSAVFGGFAAPSLAQRIEAARPRAIMTASCGIEGAKGPLPYRPLVEGAMKLSSSKPEKIIVWQRPELEWGTLDHTSGQRDWQELVQDARKRGVKAHPVPVKSTDPLYVIYTSGTTGLPKGVVREAGGHAVGLALSIRYLFGIRGPGDVIFTASDMGWVVGHSYILYGPLLVGATTVLYEGKPVGTPDAGAFWRVVERNRVNVMFTAPTALRAIRKDDPDNKHFEAFGKRGALRTLRALFLAGERSEPSIVETFQNLLSRYCAPGAQVVDHWWSTEVGSPITGIAQRAEEGCTTQLQSGSPAAPLAIKPGSAGKPMPGFDVRIVDDNGQEVPRGTMGNIVMGIPLAPTAFTTLFNDAERFYKGYLKRFDGRWIDTGDAGLVDEDGYIHVMSRSDDIINVAAHRFSTGAIEQAILMHPFVGEASIVPKQDPIKGHVPFAFITPKQPPATESNKQQRLPARAPDALFNEINALVRTQIGPIASLGGIIQGVGIIPKTRSGKTLRRVLRELVDHATRGEFDAAVNLPPTVEDAEAVRAAREVIREYFSSETVKAKL